MQKGLYNTQLTHFVSKKKISDILAVLAHYVVDYVQNNDQNIMHKHKVLASCVQHVFEQYDFFSY